MEGEQQKTESPPNNEQPSKQSASKTTKKALSETAIPLDSGVTYLVSQNPDLITAYNQRFGTALTDDSLIVSLINSAHLNSTNFDSDAAQSMNIPVIDWESINLTTDFGERFEPPFQVIKEIPRLFELVSTFNISQQPNHGVRLIDSQFSAVDTIQKAKELFNSSTLTTRTYLRSEVNGHKISSPNNYDDGLLKIGSVGSGAVNLSQQVHGAESRLFSMIDIFKAFDGKLYAFPSKIIPEKRIDNGATANLTSMPVFENMYPHFYYSIFSFPAAWYRDEIAKMITKAPIFIGDSDIRAIGSIKMNAYLSTITDQFAAELARLNFERMRESQCTSDQLQSRYTANSFKDTEVTVYSDSRIDFLSIYQPSIEEARSFMYHLLVSKRRRTEIIQELTVIIENLNLFFTDNVANVIDWGKISQATSNDQTKQIIKTALTNAGSLSFEKYIIFETFSNFFEFDFTITNSPTKGMAIFTLVSIIILAKTFPNIFQKSIASVGYAAMLAMASLFPVEYRSFISQYGFKVDSKGNRNSINNVRLTPTELTEGYTYSIFSEHTATKGNNWFIKMVTEFRSYCKPVRSPYHLDRKQNAGYPYMSQDYNTKLSWPEIDLEAVRSNVETSWSTSLAVASDFGSKLIDGSYGTLNFSREETSLKNLLLILFRSNISAILATSASLYQYSARRVQEMLKQSFGFVYDEFSDTKLLDFQYPAPLVMTTKKNTQVMLIDPIKITNLNIFSAMRYALCTRGIFKRDNRIAKMDPHDTGELQSFPMNESYIQGHILDRMYIASVMKARMMAIAMWISTSLNDHKDISNPLRSFALEFEGYLKLRNWVTLAQVVYERFGLDWNEYFGFLGGTPDARSLTTRLYRMSRVRPEPDRTNITRDELLGVDLIEMHPRDKRVFEVISKMFFKKREKTKTTSIIPKSTGFSMGKFYVGNMFASDVFNQWEMIERKNWKIVKKSISGSIGLVPFLQITRNDAITEYALPYIHQNVQLLLVMDWAYEIQSEFVNVLAKAIFHGKVAVSMVKQEVVAERVIDIADKKIDVSDNFSIDDIMHVLSLPTKGILQKEFVSTYYAANYDTNYDVQSNYIQWVIPLEPLNSNLFAASLTYGEKNERTVLPELAALEFGKQDALHVNCTSAGVPKINIGLVNWNNALPVLNEKFFKVDVNVNYTPRVDFLVNSE